MPPHCRRNIDENRSNVYTSREDIYGGTMRRGSRSTFPRREFVCTCECIYIVRAVRLSAVVIVTQPLRWGCRVTNEFTRWYRPRQTNGRRRLISAPTFGNFPTTASHYHLLILEIELTFATTHRNLRLRHREILFHHLRSFSPVRAHSPKVSGTCKTFN